VDPPENPAELVFVLFFLLHPPDLRHPPISIHQKNPAELVFVLFLLLDPPENPAELVFVLFLLLDPAEFRLMQQQKQNKNKFRRIFLMYRCRWMSEIRRIQQLNKIKTSSAGFSGGSSNKNKTKTSSAGFFWCMDIGGCLRSGGCSKKNKTKTSSAGFSGGSSNKNKNKFRRIFLVYRYRWMSEIRRIQQQNKTKTSSAGFSGGFSNKNKTKTSSAGFSGGSSNKNKNKFRRIFLVYRYRWMSEIRWIQQQNKTKQKQVPPDFPADSATKIKQKQVPPDFPADSATKTKQKQVLPDFLMRRNCGGIPPELFVFFFVFVANLTHMII
jgi:hypothetical protein